MGNYVVQTRNRLIFIILIFLIILFHNFAPVYKCKNVDKKSEWYVNNIYMSDQYYYNNLLNNTEKEAYKKLFEGIKSIESSITVNLDTYELDKVWDALICDHPELINISTYRYRSYSGYVEVKPQYLTQSKMKLRSMERKIQKKVGKFVRKVSKKSEFEKEKMIYEYLGNNNAYGQTFRNTDQSAYTVFSFSNTVCAGYGKAAQILLSNCGLESFININSNHIWNTVKLDDEYYFFDATCSGAIFNIHDIYKNICYMGLNQNQNTSAYDILYPEILPEITGEKYNYYDYYGLTLTYNNNDLSEIKKRINECEYDTIEIKFTNYSEAEDGLKRHLNELGLKAVYEYTGYCEGNQVLVLKKK